MFRPANQPPTLNAISNLTTNENAGLQTVSLSGITSGAANENQMLHVTAVSSNLTLIPNPTVNYTNANTTGTLTFTPVANAVGTAAITVTVNDGGASNNIVTQTFNITLNAVNTRSTNSSPTLDPISNLVCQRRGRVAKNHLDWHQFRNDQQNPKASGDCQGQQPPDFPALGSIRQPRDQRHLDFPAGSLDRDDNHLGYGQQRRESNNIITRTFTVTLVPPGASTSSAATTNAPANDKGSGDPAFAAVLTPLAPAGSRFAMKVAGVQGHKYVVEASTDLIHWVPMQTNTAPFTFVDAQAGQFSRRFYRSVYFP